MSHSPAPQYAPVYVAAQPRTNGLAIASFVLGLCGFALIPVVMGHVALSQIRTRGESGSAFAIVGLILGYIGCVGYLLLAIFLLGGAVFLTTGSFG